MADDDEIDILGDFSFNSCLAQNNQGIPSCSNREDTVHPQWLLDSTAANWYDTQSKHSYREKEVLKNVRSKSPVSEDANEVLPVWSKHEREVLIKEMGKYGRNVRKISENIKTKTEAEILAFIEAEFGVNLDTPTFGLEKHEGDDDVPAVVQEEIVTDDSTKVLKAKSNRAKKPYQKKTNNNKPKNIPQSKPIIIDNTSNFLVINDSDILYEDDMTIGSTESIESDVDSSEVVSKNVGKFQNAKIGKRIVGNHRRKGIRNNERSRARNSSKDLLKSPQGRVRKDSNVSEDSTKSPKMHIVFSSGQALSVSEGEQVITIKKKKDSESESDIDIDVDSDNEDAKDRKTKEKLTQPVIEEPVAVPLRKFEPMPRRQKKLNLDGGGGCTIMHTESGDLYEIAPEPRKERQPRRQPMQLIPCRFYSADKPAPFSVVLHVSALVSADVHAHTSRAEVMGLLGGRCDEGACGMGDRGCDEASCGMGGRECARPAVHLSVYRPAAAAASRTHCDMDPVSQAAAAEAVCAISGRVCAWHHSHPRFGASPSATDLRTQAALQRALGPAFVGLVTSQHWPPGRAASHYRCIHVEDYLQESESIPTGYQLSVRLAADLTSQGVSTLLADLTDIRAATLLDQYAVDMNVDICPEANMTYIDKCISSITHHMRSAGYREDDVVTRQLLQGIRDVFR